MQGGFLPARVDFPAFHIQEISGPTLCVLQYLNQGSLEEDLHILGSTDGAFLEFDPVSMDVNHTSWAFSIGPNDSYDWSPG
jgi:hypothetical protein